MLVKILEELSLTVAIGFLVIWLGLSILILFCFIYDTFWLAKSWLFSFPVFTLIILSFLIGWLWSILWVDGSLYVLSFVNEFWSILMDTWLLLMFWILLRAEDLLSLILDAPAAFLLLGVYYILKLLKLTLELFLLLEGAILAD